MKHLKFLYYKYYQFQVRMGNADVASRLPELLVQESHGMITLKTPQLEG